jgi:alpha-beta hydrolase superfamily lysophospholipase
MGSFLARKYMAAYGDDLAGCILSGTMGPGRPFGLAQMIASIQKKLKGGKSIGKFLTGISFGSHNKRIAHPVNRCAWLSTVDRVCEDYVKDPHCGFSFTAAGYYDLFSMLKEVNASGWAALVPKDLPVYLFSGEADPVGDYGRGPQQVFDRLKSAGLTDVELKLYPEGRHEMLNEANRSEVYDDVLRWIEERAIFSGWPFRGN